MEPNQVIPRPKQAAKTLGVSLPTLYRLINAGQLQKIKISERATGVLGIPEFIARRQKEAAAGR